MTPVILHKATVDAAWALVLARSGYGSPETTHAFRRFARTFEAAHNKLDTLGGNAWTAIR